MRNRQFFAYVLILAFAVQSFGQAAAGTNSFTAIEKSIATGITIETIKEATATLSADEMQGRGTMQPGGEKAAGWIADRFRKIGLKPLGDKGSYLQKIEFKETVATPETALKIGDDSLAYGTDFAFVPQNNGNKDISGDMVFIAYGIQAKGIGRDDLAGINVSGKVVVMLEGPPANFPEDAWKKQKASMLVTQGIVMKGAAAIVYIGHGRKEHPPEESISYLSRRQITMPNEEGYPAFVPPFIYVSSKAADKLFAKSGTTLKDALANAEQNSFKPIKLNQKAKVVAKYKVTKGTASNVVGYMEGSDPTLKGGCVVLSSL